MRRYIPKSKRSKPFEAVAGQFRISYSGQPYIGKVVEVNKGRYYAHENGKLNTEKRLFRNLQEAQDLHPYDTADFLPRDAVYYRYARFKGTKYSYTEELPKANYTLTTLNYEHGSFVRYFVKNKVNNEVFEIGPSANSLLTSKSSKYHWPSYTIVELEWKVTGDVADKEINGYLIEGVETINRRAVEEASKILPEIQNILTDYLEYHR